MTRCSPPCIRHSVSFCFSSNSDLESFGSRTSGIPFHTHSVCALSSGGGVNHRAPTKRTVNPIGIAILRYYSHKCRRRLGAPHRDQRVFSRRGELTQPPAPRRIFPPSGVPRRLACMCSLQRLDASSLHPSLLFRGRHSHWLATWCLRLSACLPSPA